MLRAWEDSSTAIVRGGDAHALDYALGAQGLASQGLESTSLWRPALQVLPLAIDLAFEPRDPYRVLELLTLPVGPLQGLAGRELATAMSGAPGIGGPAWRRAKERIEKVTRTSAVREAVASGLTEEEGARAADARAQERLAHIAEWLEQPGHDASQRAPCAALLAVTSRVRSWLRTLLAVTREASERDPTNHVLAGRADVLASAFAQCQTLHEALSHESREGLESSRSAAPRRTGLLGGSHSDARPRAGRSDGTLSTHRQGFGAPAIRSCGGIASLEPSGNLLSALGGKPSSRRWMPLASHFPTLRGASQRMLVVGKASSSVHESALSSPYRGARWGNRSNRIPCGTKLPLAWPRRTPTSCELPWKRGISSLGG